jgi:hypothetical protein
MNVSCWIYPAVARISRAIGTSQADPDRVKTLTPGRQFMNFSRFSAFSTITGPAERKNSLQMRRFQTISEFSHGLDPEETFSLRRGQCPVGRISLV